MTKKDLKDHTYNTNNLELGLQVYKNTPVYYHWSNCSNGTKFIQKLGQSDSDLIFTINRVWKKLEELKDISIWLRTDNHIIPMSMFDVYSTVMAHLRKNDQDDNLFNVHNISFIGPSGPYKHTSLIQLINKSLYQDFIYYYLIKNKLPLRKFRLFVDGSVVVQYGTNYSYSSVVRIKQITEYGILFSSKDDVLLEKMEIYEQMKFITLTENLINLVNKIDNESEIQLNSDLFYTTDSMQFFLVEVSKITRSLSYDSGISGEFYMFCRYIDMKKSDFPDIIKEFVELTKQKIFKQSA